MSTAVSTVLSLAALVLAAVAVVLATIANRRWVRRSTPTPLPGADHGDLPAAPDPGTGPDRGTDRDRVRADLDALQALLADLTRRVGEYGAEVVDARAEARGAAAEARGALAAAGLDPTALRHVAVVRYDAFADVGGRLSYSLAVLDDTRSGLVLTTLAGKSDVRTYVRTISAGGADGTLTVEEQQAIEAAAGPTGSRP